MEDYMYEDFLKIMGSILDAHSIPDKERPAVITGKKELAKELSDKVSRFIKWKDKETFYVGKYQLFEGDKLIVINTLSELYNYWTLNIDKK
jgi:hypothetical protein